MPCYKENNFLFASLSNRIHPKRGVLIKERPWSEKSFFIFVLCLRHGVILRSSFHLSVCVHPSTIATTLISALLFGLGEICPSAEFLCFSICTNSFFYELILIEKGDKKTGRYKAASSGSFSFSLK